MKAVKRITAVMLAVLMVLSLSACIHKKDEIAVTVGDAEFTSAYYMCALINAQSEGQQKVSESDDLSDEEKNGTKQIDYLSKKIDKKKFSDWVEDRAVELLKEIAAYKTICKENKLELTKEQKEEAANAVTYYWDNYGYSSLFEPNGVSRDTYAKFTEDSYYSEVYFQHIYGKEGKKALKAEDVKKEITDNYIIADIVNSAYAEGATDADKATAKTTLEGYAADLKAGKITFEEVYKKYNQVSEEEEAEETDELKPKNKYASILGAEDTSFANDYYETFKAYNFGEPQVIENTEKTGVMLVIKRSIAEDEFYLDQLDNYARHSLADEDFQKEITEYAKKLKADVSGYAVGQFKVKNIKVPERTY